MCKPFFTLMTKATAPNARLRLTAQHLSPTGAFSRQFSSVESGSKFTANYKNYASHAGKIWSYFHDVPLELDTNTRTANMVVEIPRWSNAKFEISKSLPGNPIVQDTKKGEVRFVKNLFPHHGYIHNYGAFPQTWEDPTREHHALALFGDNDPLDVCEIGSEIHKTGDVVRVKILGSLALVDDGELDWKVIVVDVNDPLAADLFDIHDVFVHCPGLLESTRQWFRDYKKPDGKPENTFAFNGAYKNQSETMEIVNECIDSWKKLVNCEVKGDDLPIIDNVSLEGLPGYLKDGFGELAAEKEAEAEIPSEISRQYFFST